MLQVHEKKDNLRRHIALKHRLYRHIVCDTCNVEFTTKVDITIYIYTHMCVCIYL